MNLSTSHCSSSQPEAQATDFVQDLVQENGLQIDEGLGRASAVQDAVVEGQAHFQGTGVVKHAVMNGGGQDGEDVQNAGANAGGSGPTARCLGVGRGAAPESNADAPDHAPGS